MGSTLVTPSSSPDVHTLFSTENRSAMTQISISKLFVVLAAVLAVMLAIAPSQAQVANIAAVSFSATGNLGGARFDHTATLLPNG